MLMRTHALLAFPRSTGELGEGKSGCKIFLTNIIRGFSVLAAAIIVQTAEWVVIAKLVVPLASTQLPVTTMTAQLIFLV